MKYALKVLEEKLELMFQYRGTVKWERGGENEDRRRGNKRMFEMVRAIRVLRGVLKTELALKAFGDGLAEVARRVGTFGRGKSERQS